MYECAMLRESGGWAVRQGEGPAGLDERAPEKVIYSSSSGAHPNEALHFMVAEILHLRMSDRVRSETTTITYPNPNPKHNFRAARQQPTSSSFQS